MGILGGVKGIGKIREEKGRDLVGMGKAWLRLGEIEAFFLEQVTLHGNRESRRGARLAGMMAHFDAYVDLKALVCCSNCTSHDCELVLQHAGGLTYVEPVEVPRSPVSTLHLY